jgi:hypothetical protein
LSGASLERCKVNTSLDSLVLAESMAVIFMIKEI